VLSFCSALIGVEEEEAAAAALGFYLLRFKVSCVTVAIVLKTRSSTS
jgi:hypothetical protein